MGSIESAACAKALYSRVVDEVGAGGRHATHCHRRNLALSSFFCSASSGLHAIFLFQLEGCDDLDNDIDEILLELEMKFDRTILHTVCFY